MPTEPPSEKDNGQRVLLQRTLERLPGPARKVLETLSFPHWFDNSILERLVAEGEIDAQLAAEARDSMGWGLIERWSDGALAVLTPVRELVLDDATTDAQAYRRHCLLFADTFDSLARNGGNVFDHAESVFHRLAAEPERGAELLLADGITWKSEPLFAFDALERLISGAREQQRRGFLTERAGRYVELLALYLPHAGNNARAEEQILRRLMEHEPAVDLYEAELRLRLGLAVLSRGGTTEAYDLFEVAKALFEKAGVARGKADALRSLGRASLRADQLEQARDLFVSARSMFDALGLTVSSAHCVKALAETEFYRGRWNDAEPLFQRALSDFTATAGYLGEANTRVVYAQLLSARADFDAARQHIDLATGIYEAIGHSLGLANCLKNRAVALFEDEQYEHASKVLAEAFKSYADWGSESGRANCWLWSAACEIRLGRPEKALPLLNKAAATFASIGERFGKAGVLREQGLAALAAGHPLDALKPLQLARDEFLAVGNEVEAKIAGVAIGQAAVAADFPPPFTRATVYPIAVDAAHTFANIGSRRHLRDAKALISSSETREIIAKSPLFTRLILDILEHTEYRLMNRSEDYESILRLRYKSFLSANLISPSPDRVLKFPGDENSDIFGVFIDGVLASTIRVDHIVQPYQTESPFRQFDRVMPAELTNAVGAFAFAADPHLSTQYRSIPWLTLRLWLVGAEYFNAKNLLVIARREQIAFYKRSFYSEKISVSADAQGIEWILLSSPFEKIKNKLYSRFPFLTSTAIEQRLLFGHANEEATALTVLPSAKYYGNYSSEAEEDYFEVMMIA